jgi:hypothetical protein
VTPRPAASLSRRIRRENYAVPSGATVITHHAPLLLSDHFGNIGSSAFVSDLSALIAGYTREIPTTEHRRLHQEASDFVRWGRRGGLRTLSLYGRPYFSLLARFRWGLVTEPGAAARARRLRLP